MGLYNMGYLVVGLFTIATAVVALRSHIRTSTIVGNARARKRPSSEKPASRTRNSYRATAIVGNENACEAIRAIENKKFLVLDKDIPALPVSNCDATRCDCTYAHFEDRRNADGDRRGPVGLHSELHRYLGQVEQRVRRGRRVADWT